MRKRSLRNGLRLLLAALLLIILASFYHASLAALFSLSPAGERNVYIMGMVAAAATGGYGAVLAVFGLVLPADRRDRGARIAPVFLMLLCAVALFFYLFFSSFNASPGERVDPGTTITI